MHSRLRRCGIAVCALWLAGAIVTPAALGQPAAPHLSAHLAAPGAAPACADPLLSTYLSVPEGPVIVVFEGAGFRPGEIVSLERSGATRDPAVLRLSPEGSGIGRATVASDGAFRCARALDLPSPSDGGPRYIIILGFPSSYTVRSEETVTAAPKALLDLAGAFMLPRAGTGGLGEPTAAPGQRWSLGAALFVLALGGVLTGGRRAHPAKKRRFASMNGEPDADVSVDRQA